MTRGPLTVILAAALVFVASQCIFQVSQTELAIKLQLGKPVAEAYEPGLHFKLPFIQNVVFLDSRILVYEARPAEILTMEKKNMVVDNYTRWRIADALRFYTTVRSLSGAQARMEDIVYAELRVALGQYTLNEVVSKKRSQIMEQVTQKAKALMSPYGIEVIDVRIKRTDLPAENERAIFGRMKAERDREAKQYRSEGQEEAAKIRANADRERTVLLAEAERQAAVTRGQGDANATRIFAEAVGQSPDFYDFRRSLEAYQKAFGEKTRLILTPTSPFLKYLR